MDDQRAPVFVKVEECGELGHGDAGCFTDGGVYGLESGGVGFAPSGWFVVARGSHGGHGSSLLVLAPTWALGFGFGVGAPDAMDEESGRALAPVGVALDELVHGLDVGRGDVGQSCELGP